MMRLRIGRSIWTLSWARLRLMAGGRASTRHRCGRQKTARRSPMRWRSVWRRCRRCRRIIPMRRSRRLPTRGWRSGISAMIDGLLPGAEELTLKHRGTPRLVKNGRCAYLLPTIMWCSERDHPLATKEFLFPYAAVVECPTKEMPANIGPTLVASAITADKNFQRALMACPEIDRLNLGAIPTFRLSWDQPHEGNLFEHLYRQRAFQAEMVS